MGRVCGLSTVVTPAGAFLSMYREIYSHANSIWDDDDDDDDLPRWSEFKSRGVLESVNHNIDAASAPVVLHVVYKNDWSSAFLPGCACVHLPTMTPRVKPPHTLVSVLHWLWYYCRATALSALANLTLLLGKNTLPFEFCISPA